ncbi:MAG: Fur family transcriptional regulator [Lachnospiraceae bacterium]
MTENGKIILELINTSSKHLTAEQIYDILRSRSNKIAMATVYNNLNALYEQGLIRKVQLEGQPDRYDKAFRHDHLVCRNCGKIVDICLEDLSEKLKLETGIPIDFYDLKIFYICGDCRKKGAENG